MYFNYFKIIKYVSFELIIFTIHLDVVSLSHDLAFLILCYHDMYF